MTKAGRWLRVSTMAQDEASQEPDLDRWISDQGYDVEETYRVHGASAFHGKHEPELRRAMDDMKTGRIQVLVVWKSDRIDRQEKLGALLKEAESYGGRIDFVTEPELNMLSGLGGRIMTVIKEYVNADESRTKSDRVKIKQASLRAAHSFASGKAPYGYKVVTLDDGRKTLQPTEAAEVVARIFKEVAAGASITQVAKGLTADGIPTQEGLPVWAEATISQIVANVTYRGLVQYQGQTYMTVEPLVSSADWLKAGENMKARSSARGHARRGRYLEAALLRPMCGGCGGPMYRYGASYRCAGVGPSGNSTQRRGCGNTINLDLLDAEVRAEFLADDEPYIETTVIRGTDHAEEIAAIELALKDLSRRDPEYREKRDALDSEFDRLVALPVEPDRVINVRDEHKTEGDAFREMTPEEQRAEFRRWTITVWPKDSEHQNALVASLRGRRWTLARRA